MTKNKLPRRLTDKSWSALCRLRGGREWDTIGFVRALLILVPKVSKNVVVCRHWEVVGGTAGSRDEVQATSLWEYEAYSSDVDSQEDNCVSLEERIMSLD